MEWSRIKLNKYITAFPVMQEVFPTIIECPWFASVTDIYGGLCICEFSSWKRGGCWKVSYTYHELLLWFSRLRGSYGNYQRWLLNQRNCFPSGLTCWLVFFLPPPLQLWRNSGILWDKAKAWWEGDHTKLCFHGVVRILQWFQNHLETREQKHFQGTVRF